MASWNDDEKLTSDVIWRVVALILLAWWGVLAILVIGTGRLLWRLIFGG